MLGATLCCSLLRFKLINSQKAEGGNQKQLFSLVELFVSFVPLATFILIFFIQWHKTIIIVPALPVSRPCAQHMTFETRSSQSSFHPSRQPSSQFWVFFRLCVLQSGSCLLDATRGLLWLIMEFVSVELNSIVSTFWAACFDEAPRDNRKFLSDMTNLILIYPFWRGNDNNNPFRSSTTDNAIVKRE